MTARRFSLFRRLGFHQDQSPCVFSSTAANRRARCCAAFSNLQAASQPGYAEKEQRIWDHDNVLMFCAVVYEHQRRRGKIALCEHPKGSRAWSTQAFESMIGFDAHVDQCMFGLRLLNDANEMLPVQTPTNFRVTSESLQKLMEKKWDGKHKHAHLEGHIPGVGLRSWLAESYPLWQHTL